MKVQCLEKEVTGYTKLISIEREGVTYYVEFAYYANDGYNVNFISEDKKFIDTPEWFAEDDYDTLYELDELSGSWEFVSAEVGASL